MVSKTSREAYRDLQASLSIGEQEAKIVEKIKAYGDLTNKEVSRLIMIDASTVAARVNSLIKNDHLFDAGTRKCRITGRRVRMTTTDAKRKVKDE